jgi:hypothetical protein
VSVEIASPAYVLRTRPYGELDVIATLLTERHGKITGIAKAANKIASKTRYLVNGEPTDLRLGAATRGCYRVKLTATGKAAHSGYPELGESAIEKLIDCLMALRSAQWPSDPLLGTTPLTHHIDAKGIVETTALDPVMVQVRTALAGGDQVAVFILNMGDKPAQRCYTLEQLGLAAPLMMFDWTTQSSSLTAIERLEVTLDPHDGVLVFLSPTQFTQPPKRLP